MPSAAVGRRPGGRLRRVPNARVRPPPVPAAEAAGAARGAAGRPGAVQAEAEGSPCGGGDPPAIGNGGYCGSSGGPRRPRYGWCP